MAFEISINATHDEQLHACLIYIRTQICSSEFHGTKLNFLPPSAIDDIATLSNIQALVAKDPGLAAINWPSHSREYFNNKVTQFGKKMFVAAVYQGLGMKFLRDLMNKGEDLKLPVPETVKVEDEDLFYHDTDIEVFRDGQALVCAPVFDVNKFDQSAPFASSLPFTEVHYQGVEDGASIYGVKFHNEHLKSFGAHVPGIESKMYLMKVFPEKLSENEVAGQAMKVGGKFGFHCEGQYYLVYKIFE